MRLSCRRPVVLAPTACPPNETEGERHGPRGGAVRPGAEIHVMRPTGPGNWESRRDPPWSLQRELSLAHTWISACGLQNCKEDELLLFGARFAVQLYSHLNLEAGMFAEPPPPRRLPFGGRMNPRMQGEGWAWEGPPQSSGFFCHLASPQLSSRTGRPGWVPRPCVTGI